MKNFKYILAGAIFFASLTKPAFAAEDVEESKQDTVVYYDQVSLDIDQIKEDASKGEKKLEKTEIKPTLYKDANDMEVKEEAKSDDHPDRIEITGTSKNATGTKDEPGKVSWRGYKQGVISNFDIRTKNPDHINGAYINRFLEKRGHYTALKGYGDTIMKYSQKYGINVGIFMGQIAKETTFGMAAAGGKYNFGSIRYTKGGYGSEYGYAYAGKSKWINPPTVDAGVEVLFKLMREAYADKGYTTYKSFINRYSPAFENNHRSFEQLAVGTMNALAIPY